MADVFPTALEAHHSPTANGSTDIPSVHRADTIKRIAEAIEALQAKVGIDNSQNAASLDKRMKTLEDTPPGSGAPTNAEYLVATSHAGLSAERVTTDTATVAWDHAEAGKAKASVIAASITHTHVAAANIDGIAGTASMRTLGTGTTQACAGDDARLSDSRTPSGSATGDLTGSYPGPTIAANAVTLAKLADIATDRLLGRDTAASGDPEELTVGGGIEFTGTGGIQRSALTGDVTATAGSGSTTIANDAVTYAKMQNVSAASKLLGRGSAGGSGDVEEITLGTNLSMSGTTLNATGGGGNTLYAPGSTTVATGNFQVHVKRLELTTTQRLTLAGTARFRLMN